MFKVYKTPIKARTIQTLVNILCSIESSHFIFFFGLFSGPMTYSSSPEVAHKIWCSSTIMWSTVFRVLKLENHTKISWVFRSVLGASDDWDNRISVPKWKRHLHDGIVLKSINWLVGSIGNYKPLSSKCRFYLVTDILIS